MQTSTIKIIAITLTILVSAYLKIIRPWQLHWGSRDDEIERSMPGDEIVVKPSFNATRAVTINTPDKSSMWLTYRL